MPTLRERIQHRIFQIRRTGKRLPLDIRVWWHHHISRQPFWFTDRYGITCRLSPSDPLAVFFHTNMLFDDPGTCLYLQQTLAPGMTVFDVGANIGAFGLLATQAIAPSGTIHMFEPTAATYARLQENITHTASAQAIAHLNQLGVSDHEGAAEIHTFAAQYASWNSLGTPEYKTAEGQAIHPEGTETINLTTLDAYCAAQKISRIDLLKIDVEGFEPEVLAGCKQLLAEKKIARIIFELSSVPVTGTGRSAQAVFAPFAACGQAVYRIANDGALLPVTNETLTNEPAFANYLVDITRSQTE